MRIFSLLVPFLIVLLVSPAAAQSFDTNYSLQVGGQVRLLRPVSYNYVVETFNTSRPTWDPQLDEIRWTQGLSFAAGMHRGRSEVRVQFQSFGASSFGQGPDSLGTVLRREVILRGQTYQFGLASQLVRINRNLNFGVGGAFSINRWVVRSASAPEMDFDPTAEFPTVQQFIRPSLNLIAPIHIGLAPWVELNIEPTYQVFFGPADWSDFAESLVPNSLNSNDPRLEGELDHFGISVAIIGYLRRRY